jgi:hypothetical protein
MKRKTDLEAGMRELLAAIHYDWPPDTPILPQWMREARALKRAGLCKLRRPRIGQGRGLPRAILTEAGLAMVATLNPRTGEPPVSELIGGKDLSESVGNKDQGAKEFLADVLIDGTPVSRNTIVERGAERGFSLDQLKRVKKVLGVQAFKGIGSKTNQWFWVLRSPDREQN